VVSSSLFAREKEKSGGNKETIMGGKIKRHIPRSGASIKGRQSLVVFKEKSKSKSITERTLMSSIFVF